MTWQLMRSVHSQVPLLRSADSENLEVGPRDVCFIDYPPGDAGAGSGVSPAGMAGESAESEPEPQPESTIL